MKKASQRKKVTNTYHEPLVISLLARSGTQRGREFVPDRTQQNLLQKESVDVEEWQVSSELQRMKKRGRVTIEDIDVEPEMAESDVIEVEVERPPQPYEEEKEPSLDEGVKDDENTEQELLQDDFDPQEG